MEDRSAFEKVIEVTPENIDELNHVNNIAYLKWVLDIAKEHWFFYSSEEINSIFYWIVLSHYIEYKRPCFLGEELRIKTKVGAIEGARWPRKVWIYKPDGKLAVHAETEWCLMEKSSHRPARISKNISTIFLSE